MKREKEQYWQRAKEIVNPYAEMAARRDFVYLVSGVHGVRNLEGLDEYILAKLGLPTKEKPRRHAIFLTGLAIGWHTSHRGLQASQHSISSRLLETRVVIGTSILLMGR